jgi:hypothetical protein
MANNSIKLISARAKKLRAGNKSMAWKSAIKKASQQLRAEGAFGKATTKRKKVGKVKKHNTRRRKVSGYTKSGFPTPTDGIRGITKSGFPTPTDGIGGISQNMYAIRDSLEKDIFFVLKAIKNTRAEKRPGYKTMLKVYQRKLKSLKAVLREQNKLINSLLH